MMCRLCKGTEFLFDLFMDTSLLEEISFCLDLKICREDDSIDSLSPMICKLCKRKVKKFYEFKLNCLQVDTELKLLNISSKINTNYTSNIWLPDVANGFLEICSSENTEKDISDPLHFTKESNHELNENNSIVCEVCGSIYNSKTEYRRHLSFHSNVQPYKCKFCPKRFTRADSRENHIKAHLGIKRSFICEICGRSTTKRQDLIRHMKIHSDERNHECCTCGRRFKRSMDLLTHKRTHTGVRPYKCTNCGKDYTSHSGLRKHRNSVCREFGI